MENIYKRFFLTIIASGRALICANRIPHCIPCRFFGNAGFFLKMERVSIFIDGENFLYGMKSINPRYTDFNFDFKKYIDCLTKGRKLIDIYYFIAPLKQNIT